MIIRILLTCLFLMITFTSKIAHANGHHTSLKVLVEDKKKSIPELQGSGDKILKRFSHWVKKRERTLDSHSKIAKTSLGHIEYVIKGKGPIVLCIHGGFGGYDQGLLVGDSLMQHGFRVLSPSRPGYLRTPISVGATNEEQADAMVALLDALEIDKVSVIGFSAGSQIAFIMAVKYPERVKSVVFECLGAQPGESALYELLTEILQLDGVPNFASWLFFLYTKYFPANAVKFILSNDSSLSKSALKKRINFVLHSRWQSNFALQMILSTTPLGPRSVGLANDISPTNLDPWPNFNYSLLKTPSMIIQSKFDSNGSYAEAQFAASQIPGVKFITLEECGHFIWLGKERREWEKKLRRFLKNHQ